MKNENKIEVHKIDIKIGDKVISLKPEQAKELKKILNEMFEEQKVVHHHHDHYRYWWTQPTYVHANPYPTPYWTVTCQNAMQATSDSLQGLGQNISNTFSLALNAT